MSRMKYRPVYATYAITIISPLVSKNKKRRFLDASRVKKPPIWIFGKKRLTADCHSRLKSKTLPFGSSVTVTVNGVVPVDAYCFGVNSSDVFELPILLFFALRSCNSS